MLAAQLQHPHIVPVLSAGEHGELLWYTMPFVEGVSLRDALAHVGKFSPRTVTRVLHDVLDALAYAHRRGVIHRDIKPGNILHHGSHSLVTDFGVAKALSARCRTRERLGRHRDRNTGVHGARAAGGGSERGPPDGPLRRRPARVRAADGHTAIQWQLAAGDDGGTAHADADAARGMLPRSAGGARGSRHAAPRQAPRGSSPDSRRRVGRARGADDALWGDSGWSIVRRVCHRGAKWRASGARIAGARFAANRDGRYCSGGGRGGDRVRSYQEQLRCTRRPTHGVNEPAPTIHAESTAIVSPSPLVRLTHDDSLRIAVAVRTELAKARVSGTPSPNGDRALDSLRRSLTRAYTDSALRGGAVAAALPNATPVAAGHPPAPARPPQVPRSAAVTRATPRATPPAPKAPVFARPRRVAILPVRDATLRAEVAPTTHALEDSLRKAIVSMGYGPATDSELLRLLTQPDLAVQRRIADSLGIGAVVMTILSTRGDEIVAQTIVLDVWRNYPFSDRTATDLDKPQEALGVVRNVSRALERVSWRSRTDPKLVLVFDLENQTGNDSVAVLARQLSDSLRTLVANRFGAQVVADTTARATRDVVERRAVGSRLGVGALIAGTIFRARGDSVTLRLSTRDMSEDKTMPNIDVRAARSELIASFQVVAERVLADLAQVNWGPKNSR